MTLSDNRMRATRRLAAALRWGGAVVAATALVALGLVNASSPARAASTPSGYDQMNGTGSTASAVTVPWTQGLRNSSNQPITNPGSELNPNADRSSGTGPYAFMDNGVSCQSNCTVPDGYGAFKNITVTVSQTQDIGHGGITVSWMGAEPTNEAAETGGFMQIMECYGNAPAGPSPENCEFGQGLVPLGFQETLAGRVGDLCSSQTLSATNPTGSLSGGGPSNGCDPYEPATPAHYPCTLTNGVETGPDCISPGTDYSIPFVPENGAEPALYQHGAELAQAFDQFSTNEVDVANTISDGTGQQQFETLTSAQSSALGCGQQQPSGTPQGCWLVIVPRGIYEPNGYDTSKGGTRVGLVHSSPLSAGNWAQRIQVHLDYAPLPNFCPLGGTARESLMEGSQLVTRAVQSWELKLNQDANCTLIYHLAQTPEQQVTNEFVTPLTPGVPANGLAFTTVPIGDDRLRSGQSPPPLPNIVYAPVAIMALDFGFHVDQDLPTTTTGSQQVGYLSTPVKLSPQLLARALTQSYVWDLTDYSPSTGSLGPAWAAHNPFDMSNDPQFQTLNPEVIPHTNNSLSTAPLDTTDHSAYYQQIWQWVQGDPATSAWLDGASNPAVTIDPLYESQQLGKPPAIDSMPRSYPCEQILPSSGSTKETRCSTDVEPYVADFDAASAAVLAANPLAYGNGWDPTVTAPNGTSGYWFKLSAQPPGNIWEWAVDATPYTAAYGLVPGQLCNDSGGNCVGPTVASVTAAVNDAKPDSDGLLEVNPASPGAGAYPLTEVIYAAVRTDMPAQALTDYANFISFAAGHGQTPGQAGGDLPAGYLPLTTSLQAQANAAVAQLHQIATGGPTSTATPTASNSSSSSSSSASTPPGGTNGSTGTNPGGTQPSTTPNSPASTGTPHGTAGTSPASSVASSCATPTVTPTATARTATPTVTPTPTASPCATPTGPVIVPPTIQLAAGSTPGQPVGPIRLVLVIVVVIGIAGAGGGILLRRGQLPRWPGRSRP